MTFIIHGLPFSTATARVLLTLYEKNVEDFEIVRVELAKGEHKNPEYLKLQPFGQIPTFTDGDFTIFESRAIARVIAHRFEGQGTPLYGTTVRDKALVEQWLEVEGQNVDKHISTVVFQIVFSALFGKTLNEELVEAELAKLKTVLSVYEQHLSTHKYLAGDFFSLADLSHIASFHHFVYEAKKEDVLDSYPAVKKWLEDIFSRPSSQKWVALLNSQAVSK